MFKGSLSEGMKPEHEDSDEVWVLLKIMLCFYDAYQIWT